MDDILLTGNYVLSNPSKEFIKQWPEFLCLLVEVIKYGTKLENVSIIKGSVTEQNRAVCDLDHAI